MFQPLFHPVAPLYCSCCGAELRSGDVYWYLNGCITCDDCLPSFAREELAPFRLIRGKEGAR